MTLFLARKMPINCPICGGPMINDYDNVARDLTRLTKTCSKRLDHSIKIRACDRDHNYINWISILWGAGVINWYYGSGSLLLNTMKGVDYHIPFFEPDFSDFKKLKEKLKTYLLFS